MAGITSDLAKKSGDPPRRVSGRFPPGHHCWATRYVQSFNIVWTSWWNPYLPVAFEWQILINLLLPPLFRVKVYSPFRLEASRTKNVPSGASRSFSLTSSRVISPQYHSWATNAGSPSGWPEHINFYQSDICKLSSVRRKFAKEISHKLT